MFMLYLKGLNMLAVLKLDLSKINPLWGQVEILPLQETLKEFGESYPAVDMEGDRAYFQPEKLAKLLIENDAQQVWNYLKSIGYVLVNPTFTQLLDALMQLDKQQPGFLLNMFFRFNPVVNKQNLHKRSTRLFRSIDFWVQDSPHLFRRKIIEMRLLSEQKNE